MHFPRGSTNDTIISDKTLPISVVSILSISTWDIESSPGFLIPAICKTSNSNYENWSDQLASLPVVSTRLRIHFNALWFVGIAKLLPSNDGCSNGTAPATAQFSQSVVLRFCSSEFSTINQQQGWLFVRFGCSRPWTEPTEFAHESNLFQGSSVPFS